MNTELIEAVKQAKNGDTAAFDEIYRLTNRSVYFTALKIVGDPADAEDIVQDTYINAFKKLPELKDSKAFPKWLKVITVNLSKNHLTKKRPELFESEEQEEQLINKASLNANAPYPEQILDQKETERMIYELIDELPPEQRDAVMLYYYDELSVDSIAEMKNVSANTIKSRLNYARKHIKKELESLAVRGVKLYGIPAVGALLAALERGANTAPAAVVSTAVATTKSGTGAKAVTAAAGAALVGIGIAAGVHLMGGAPPHTDEEELIMNDISQTEEVLDLNDISQTEESGAFSEQIYLDGERPYKLDSLIDVLDNTAIFYTGDGYRLTRLDTGDDVTGYKFSDLIYTYDDSVYACLLREDGVFCTYNSSLYEGCIDIYGENIMRCKALREPYATSPRIYTLVNKKKNDKELFMFSETEWIGDKLPRYHPFRSRYAFIGTQGDADCFGGSYLIAVDPYGYCFLIYNETDGLLGLEEYLDSETSLLEEQYPNYSVLKADAYDDYILLDITDGTEQKQLICCVHDQNLTECTEHYTDLIYADIMAENGLLLLRSDSAENSYTICDQDLNVILSGLDHAENSNYYPYLLIRADGREGYFNYKTRETIYYDEASVFGSYGALVKLNGEQFFINEEFEICSEALDGDYTMLDWAAFVYSPEEDKLYQYMTNEH